jgi:hypothetical protein
MKRKAKIVAFIFVVLFSNIPVTLAQYNGMPVDSFWILTDAYAEGGVNAGTPFKIVIFSYDKNGHQTYTFNGNATLSVKEGTITPSTISFHDGISGPNVTIDGTNSAIITVDDGKGHIGTSLPISIILASPTPNPTVTSSPTLTSSPPTNRNAPHMELSDWILTFMPLIVMVIVLASIIVLLHRRHLKKH